MLRPFLPALSLIYQPPSIDYIAARYPVGYVHESTVPLTPIIIGEVRHLPDVLPSYKQRVMVGHYMGRHAVPERHVIVDGSGVCLHITIAANQKNGDTLVLRLPE